MRAPAVLLLALSLCSPAILPAADHTLHLALGDPARREREAPLGLDAITDTATGDSLSPGELAGRLSGVSILFVGESHTDAEFHAVQLRVIEELVTAGREVVIGLEMFPTSEQAHLDSWSQGWLTEEGFLHLARWYENWGYPWPYYREIFDFAREHHLAMVGLNAPREVVSAVRSKGLKGLSPEEAAHLPPKIDTDNAEHRQLFRAFFDDGDALHGGLTDEQWATMFAAQCTWDATMGSNAAKVLGEAPRAERIVVVLIGSGHVAYGLGIERQARLWLPAGAGKLASLVPVAVTDDDGKPVSSVRASFANFLWGLPRELAPRYPSLGLATTAAGLAAGRKVVFVEEGSPAEAAGFATGDLLLTLDGQPLPDKETYNRLLAAKRWGDTVTLGIQRGEEKGEEKKEITAWLRRPVD